MSRRRFTIDGLEVANDNGRIRSTSLSILSYRPSFSREAFMRKKLSDIVKSAKESIHTIADNENTKTVLNWSKKTGIEIKDQSMALGKEVADSDLGKAAAKGAAIGAVVAVPVPVIGPIAGAILGAGVGAYLNLKHGLGKSSKETDKLLVGKNDAQRTSDALAHLQQLDELRGKGAITVQEYEEKKAELLKRI